MKKILKFLGMGVFRFFSAKLRAATVNNLLRIEPELIIKDMFSKDIQINNLYDIGAHTGNFANDLSQKFPLMKLYLFEANPTHEDTLRKSKHWYHIGVLSDVAKKVSFYARGEGGDSYFKENSSVYKDAEVQHHISQTLDNLVEKEGIPFPDFIKIDTQGSEMDILKGAAKCLEHAKAIMLEVPIYPYNHGAPTMTEYVDFLLDSDFYPARCVELHNNAGVLAQLDIVFIRKSELMKINKNFNDFYLT
jgi:FkbM family methyltransferase